MDFVNLDAQVGLEVLQPVSFLLKRTNHVLEVSAKVIGELGNITNNGHFCCV